MAAKSTKPSQKSKTTDINLIPFHKLKDLFGDKKPSDEEKTIENETYSALNKISKVIDNALFPMFSFEPQNDIRKISNVTSKKDKNKERKRENQQNSLKTKLLMKNTFYQCFETVSQCFAYREHSFGTVVHYLRFSNETLKNMKLIEQPTEKSSHPFNMPSFLASLIAFKKIDQKTEVTHGIMMKRLSSNPGKPIIDKPLSHYRQNYYHALIMYKNLSKEVNQRKMLDYMISWESNAPSVIDYRFFMLSIDSFFHKRLVEYYNDDHFANPEQFYHDFMFTHPAYYCGDKSVGFLSCRWILPMNMSMVFSASEMGQFTTLNPHNVSLNQSFVIKLNFNLKDNNRFVAKVFELYDVISHQDDVKYFLTINGLATIASTSDAFFDKTVTDDITFFPSMDFNHKEISINVKNFDLPQTSNSKDDIRSHKAYLANRSVLLMQIQEMKRKSEHLSSEKPDQDDNIFPSIKYSMDLQDKQNSNLIDDYNRRLMVQEILHQWTRDMVAMDFMKQYITKIDEDLMPLNPDILYEQISLLHESVCKTTLLNEFDLIHLNTDYMSINKMNDMILPTKMAFNSLPLTVDDIMIKYFMFLSNLYNALLMNKKINDTYIKTSTDYDMIINTIHNIPAANVIKWMTVWLIIEEIPHYIGFDVSKADTIFNRRFLPILYQYDCLPLKSSEKIKITCFDSKMYKNDDYIWTMPLYNQKIYKNMNDFIHHQKDLGRLLITKTMYTYAQKKSPISFERFFDPKRYYIFDNLAFFEHHNELIKKMFSINPTNVNNHFDGKFNDMINTLSMIKRNTPSDVVFQVQNMIDFYMSCMNQYNAFMSYLIIKGNDFIQKRDNVKQSGLLKHQAGASYNADLISYEEIYGYSEVETDVFYLDEIITMKPRKIEDKPTWLYMYNPNLEKLEITVRDVRRTLNQYRRPDISQLEFFTDIISRVYVREENERILTRCIPVVDDIIERLNHLIIDDYNIDKEHLVTAIVDLNQMIDDFIDAYAINQFGLDLSQDRFNYKKIEELTVESLWDVPKRKNKMMRFMFIKEYITRQYEIVSDFYNILDIVRFSMVGLDNFNTMQRLNHSLYSVNNYINQEMPVYISQKHEVIQRNITLKAVPEDKLFESQSNRKTIVELNNFRYLFRSQSTGIRFAPTFDTAYPGLKIVWSIVIKNKYGDLSDVYDDETITRVNPLDDGHIIHGDRPNQYKVMMPYLRPDLVHFIMDNKKCVLYADLKIYLLKPEISQEELETEYPADLVVYPSLSLVGSKIAVLDDDVLNISQDNIYERINRFNNYLYLNQPDELLFFHANVIQHFG